MQAAQHIAIVGVLGPGATWAAGCDASTPCVTLQPPHDTRGGRRNAEASLLAPTVSVPPASPPPPEACSAAFSAVRQKPASVSSHVLAIVVACSSLAMPVIIGCRLKGEMRGDVRLVPRLSLFAKIPKVSFHRTFAARNWGQY